MISPIRVTPSTGMPDFVNAYNDLANQLEADNRTRIVRDETGVDRILIGKGPKGNYVVAITIPTKDVVKELEA